MVRPANFAWNVETQASNRFQREEPALAGDAKARACSRVRCTGPEPARKRDSRACRRGRSRAGPSRRSVPEQLDQPARRRHRGALSDTGAQSPARAPAGAGRGARRTRRVPRGAPPRPHASRAARQVPRGHRQHRVRSRRARGLRVPVATHPPRAARRNSVPNSATRPARSPRWMRPACRSITRTCCWRSARSRP